MGCWTRYKHECILWPSPSLWVVWLEVILVGLYLFTSTFEARIMPGMMPLHHIMSKTYISWKWRLRKQVNSLSYYLIPTKLSDGVRTNLEVIHAPNWGWQFWDPGIGAFNAGVAEQRSVSVVAFSGFWTSLGNVLRCLKFEILISSRLFQSWSRRRFPQSCCMRQGA